MQRSNRMRPTRLAGAVRGFGFHPILQRFSAGQEELQVALPLGDRSHRQIWETKELQPGLNFYMS